LSSAISYLSHAFARDLDLDFGCLLGFLDEGVQHNYALARKKAVERSSDARFASLEQSIAEGARVGEP
jgi:hypothetical protein